jgi:hypothetical protein
VKNREMPIIRSFFFYGIFEAILWQFRGIFKGIFAKIEMWQWQFECQF